MRTLALAAVLALVLAPFTARAQGPSTGSGQAVAVQRVSGKRIATIAQRQLAFVSHDSDRGFVRVSIVPDQVVSEGRVALHAGTPSGTSTFVNVPVEIDVDGKPDRTILVGYRVQQFVETAVAAHDLAPGTVLSADDLTMARVPFTGVQPNGVDVLVGRRTDNAVLKGQPVRIQSTAVNQIVKAGTTIVFIIRDSGVTISADAIARTGGGLGDQVFVYNPSTHKALSGTVTGPGTVELDISGGDNP
jgi:flagella basal body P-ring formation protein FlgA